VDGSRFDRLGRLLAAGHPRRAVAKALLGGALAALGPAAAGAQKRCATTADCPPHHYCPPGGGTCVRRECAANRDCPPHHACSLHGTCYQACHPGEVVCGERPEPIVCCAQAAGCCTAEDGTPACCAG
jgi:hypothetical protein